MREVVDRVRRCQPEGESDVAVKLGVTVKSHTLVTNKTASISSENTSELIAYKP